MAPKKREGVKGAPTEQNAATGATEAICGLVTKCEPIEKSKAKKLSVDVGRGDGGDLTIVTSWDVSEGMRVVIAVVGSFVNEAEVVESVVSGVSSCGLLCDGTMLGWTGAGVAAGSPALLPSSFAPGDAAPSERPKRGGKAEEPAFAGFDKQDDGPTALFGPVLTKDEKKALAAKKKAERAAKKGGGATESEGTAEGGVTAAASDKPRVAPTKADLKRIRKAVADKRKAGEEVATDDELEAAGFLLEGEVEVS